MTSASDSSFAFYLLLLYFNFFLLSNANFSICFSNYSKFSIALSIYDDKQPLLIVSDLERLF